MYIEKAALFKITLIPCLLIGRKRDSESRNVGSKPTEGTSCVSTKCGVVSTVETLSFELRICGFESYLCNGRLCEWPKQVVLKTTSPLKAQAFESLIFLRTHNSMAEAGLLILAILVRFQVGSQVISLEAKAPS